MEGQTRCQPIQMLTSKNGAVNMVVRIELGEVASLKQSQDTETWPGDYEYSARERERERERERMGPNCSQA